MLGHLPCPWSCLCFCPCFVCLLVGRHVFFLLVACVVSVLVVCCPRCLVESFVCCGGAWGVFFSFPVGVKRVCVPVEESPAAAPSHQSSCCPVCPVPASFFVCCDACTCLACTRLRTLRLRPLVYPLLACNTYLSACKSCSASSCLKLPVVLIPPYHLL